MIFVALSLIVGISIGFILRNKDRSLRISNNVSSLLIFILLALLGISLGRNDAVLDNLSVVGLQAIVLTFGGVAGSVLISLFIYRYFFKEGDR
jgi:uncharacterized membrane protein YbjE (DUF340 family)